MVHFPRKGTCPGSVKPAHLDCLAKVAQTQRVVCLHKDVVRLDIPVLHLPIKQELLSVDELTAQPERRGPVKDMDARGTFSLTERLKIRIRRCAMRGQGCENYRHFNNYSQTWSVLG